ncbi:hypothetical protein C1H46_044232 [Malus baccata]|uniref:Major facilitator superfamily (MFS) profile domain-containing protein n=1 Tax=Malus baccata TaxID=106549 RepID=A0A540K7N7_MALBA|nr:hypothetical protein C1H46_044232 [Malus baccata]
MARDKKSSCSSSFLFFFSPKPTSINPSSYDNHSSSSEPLLLPQNHDQTRPEWKSMPYILGTESISTMATFGMTANFMVYLVREYHMEQVTAANIINIWICSYCLLTIVGASIADIYLGKFLTIAFASLATLTGMVTITLTALVPQLRPPPCILDDSLQCVSSATITQLGFLLAGLCWLGIGTGGIRPCSIPFGIDQFDSTTVEGRKSVGSYLNWYYTSSSLVLMINQTLVVYIQDSVSWSLGFGIPTLLMLCAIPLFLAGSKIYCYVKPEGSTFSSFAHVLVAAYKKRCLKLHNDERVCGVFFGASPKVDGKGNVVQSKLLLSTEFRFLKKAALVVDNEVGDDGSCPNPWRLCSIQQVEEVICVVKTLPIWASGAIFLIAYAQEGTFVVSQALRMDRHIGLNFEMPAGSIKLMSMMTVIISLPLYNRVLQPAVRKITKHEDGLPALQRIGIGYFFSILCMMVAGLIEQRRRALATSQDSSNGIAAMSVFWLFPQQIMLGLLEVFGSVGHIEFYNKEFPESMKSIGNSLPYLCLAGATYLSSVVVSIVHSVTGKHGQPNWLDNDINVGRLDNYYFLIAGLGVVNFLYFLCCACGYTYKASVKAVESVETNPIV